jgi:hypothetical protein
MPLCFSYHHHHHRLFFPLSTAAFIACISFPSLYAFKRTSVVQPVNVVGDAQKQQVVWMKAELISLVATNRPDGRTMTH